MSLSTDWLWGHQEFSDVTLLIHPCSTGGDDREPQGCPPTSQPTCSLHLHSVVLAAASPGHFRPHLLRLRTQEIEHAVETSGAEDRLVLVAVAVSPEAPEAMHRTSSAGMRDSPAQGPGTPDLESSRPDVSPATANSVVDEPASPQTPLTGSQVETDSNLAAQTPPGKVARQDAVEAQDTSTPSTPRKVAPLVSLRLQVVGPPAEQEPNLGPHQIKTLHLTLHPGEPNTVPEAVLRHVYTGKLPDNPEQLIWMLWRADYLDLAATVTACVTKLQSLADNKQLTLQHATQLHSLPPLQTATGAEQPHQSVINSVLATTMPVAVDVYQVDALRKGLLNLPLALVKQWVRLKSVTIDSGNTLAVLFTAWYDAQPTPPTDDQCQELSALLPLFSLTLCYHLQVVPQLRWCTTRTARKSVIHTMARVYPADELAQENWTKEGQADSGVTVPAHTYQQTCTLSPSQLLSVWEGKRVDLATMWLAGLWCQPVVYTEGSTRSPGKRRLWFELVLSWPTGVSNHCCDQGLGKCSLGMEVEVKVVVSPSEAGVEPLELCRRDVGAWSSGTSMSVGQHLEKVEDLVRSPTSTAQLTMTCQKCL